METKQANFKSEELVDRYFGYIRELRSGDADSVAKLMGLWDADGVFEFAGSPPVVGTFAGKMAVETLYKNRLMANGMPLTLSAHGEETHARREAALGVVDTEVSHVRVLNGKTVAGWTTLVGTKAGAGFKVSGSHTFTFRDGKIATLKVVVSPKTDSAAEHDLRLEDLRIEDIGQLARAAWAVV